MKLKGDKARRAFDRHFFLIGKPLLAIEDRSVARLRLLVLEAELRRVVKATRRAPLSLDRVHPPWATDPYDGRPFGYLPDGAEFRSTASARTSRTISGTPTPPGWSRHPDGGS